MPRLTHDVQHAIINHVLDAIRESQWYRTAPQAHQQKLKIKSITHDRIARSFGMAGVAEHVTVPALIICAAMPLEDQYFALALGTVSALSSYDPSGNDPDVTLSQDSE